MALKGIPALPPRPPDVVRRESRISPPGKQRVECGIGFLGRSPPSVLYLHELLDIPLPVVVETLLAARLAGRGAAVAAAPSRPTVGSSRLARRLNQVFLDSWKKSVSSGRRVRMAASSEALPVIFRISAAVRGPVGRLPA